MVSRQGETPLAAAWWLVTRMGARQRAQLGHVAVRACVMCPGGVVASLGLGGVAGGRDRGSSACDGVELCGRRGQSVWTGKSRDPGSRVQLRQEADASGLGPGRAVPCAEFCPLPEMSVLLTPSAVTALGRGSQGGCVRG